MTLHTRSLTMNERLFRQISALNQTPTQSLSTAKVSIVSTPAVGSELINGGPVPDLAQPVFAGPTIWQQVMAHFGKYWGYYAFGTGLVIGCIYFYNQQKKMQDEMNS